jgi:DNA-binding MarR family transcriptional regulator
VGDAGRQLAEPMRRRLMHARLLTLLILMRQSADLSYRRQLGLVELHRRLLALVGNYDGLTSVEIVALSGQDKAQISRAVKALSESGLVERTSLRAPVRLTEVGRAAFDAVIAIADERNIALTRGVAPRRLAAFRAMTARLTSRAALLLEDERLLSGNAAGDADAGEEPVSYPDPPAFPKPTTPRGGERPLARILTPSLIALVAYLQRSATIAYRRETGLSNFSWQVLSLIGEKPLVTLAELIAVTTRDKSQVGRTVRRLEEAGCVIRSTRRSRREVVLSATPAGMAMYADMCVDALRRDAFLLAEEAPADRAAFGATLDLLTANAQGLFDSERASAAERPRVDEVLSDATQQDDDPGRPHGCERMQAGEGNA